MTVSEMLSKVKSNVKLEEETPDFIISDVILAACDYCNMDLEDIPETLEPFIRKKVKGILDYEKVNGSGYIPEVSSIKEGDGMITWSQTEGNTKAGIYGLTHSDKQVLRRHRRIRR